MNLEKIKSFVSGMDTTSWILVGGIFLMIVVIIGYSVYSKKHHVSSADAALQRKRKQKYWNNMYQIMSDSRIFKGHIKKQT